MEQKTLKRRITRRRRGLPHRKWTDYETTLLVNYVKDNKHDFEKPSARLFYSKFLQIHHMSIQWSLVRNKTRNLRILFEKAFHWQNSEAAQNMPDLQSRKSMIHRMCPHYNTLEVVFGDRIKERTKASPSEYNSTLEIEYAPGIELKHIYSPPSSPHQHQEEKEEEEQERHFPPVFEGITVAEHTLSNHHHHHHETPTQSAKRKTVENCNTNNGKYDASDCLMEVVKMMSSYLRERSEYQMARLELENKKFDFEKEKTFRELELREKEMEKHERLQVMEIESKERISLKELEYKHRQF